MTISEFKQCHYHLHHCSDGHHNNNGDEISNMRISLEEFKKCLPPLDNTSAERSAGCDLEEINWIWTGENYNGHHQHHQHQRQYQQHHQDHHIGLSGLIYVQLYHEITVAEVVNEVSAIPITIFLITIVLVFIDVLLQKIGLAAEQAWIMAVAAQSIGR